MQVGNKYTFGGLKLPIEGAIPQEVLKMAFELFFEFQGSQKDSGPLSIKHLGCQFVAIFDSSNTLQVTTVQEMPCASVPDVLNKPIVQI